jgi:uncharacterized protein YbjT (DUF2867 family)
MDIVTGSFGYIGKYITRELLGRGRKVSTITTHPDKPNPYADQVTAYPYNFENPDQLIKTLGGCDVLFNTYWVRFDYRSWSFDKALDNTRILFSCAKQAEVRKVVHISVTNPSVTDDLPYYRGKALQEKALIESGLDYTIIRPTLVFGIEDILVNNIAWTIRKFPIVPVFGSGTYQVQPIFVEDLANIAADATEKFDSKTLDAIGPETYTYKDFLQLLANELERNIPLIHLPANLGIYLGRLIGLFVNDVVLTKDELRGLMENKLTSNQIPNGSTLFSEWLSQNISQIGTTYTSELNRHFYWKAGS